MISEVASGSTAGSLLTCDVAAGVGTIKIDRPAKRNAMTADMWRAVPGLVRRLTDDPEVRVIVVTGAGDDFCAGADISQLNLINKPGGDHLSVAAEEALAACPKPTIAAIRGYCVGGGCQLADACDLRFAADDARFAITPAKIGIIYPVPATERLVRLVGPASAKYLLYSGELIDAAHALRIGLVDEVVPAGRLTARVAEFAATLATRSQLTQQATKEIIDAVASGADTEQHARRWQDEVVEGDEVAEGVAAFLERRPPRFTWSRGTR